MVDKHIRVLLIEEKQADAQLIKKALNGNMKKSFSLEHADSLSKGLESLRSKEIDIILHSCPEYLPSFFQAMMMKCLR